MGNIIDRLKRLWPNPRASGTARPAKWLVDWVRGDESDSGITMTVDKALSFAPVLQALSVLSGDVGQLPFVLHKRTDDRNKVRDRKHPAFRLARRRANPYMSATTLRETLMLHTLLHGNGVAEIEWNGGHRPKALWPLLPHRTHLEIIHGKPWYVTRVGEEPGAVEKFIRPENVIHISNFGPDGTWGYSTITLARNSWGLGLAGEKYANRYFKNNGMPSGTLESPNVMGDDAYKRLKRDWKQIHEGLDNAARVAILEEGTKYAPIAFNHKDSQWLESREFQRTDVASWFNLPPHKVGDLKHATFTNIEEQNRSYLDTSLMRWLVKWQDEFNEKLLTKTERDEDSHFFEFNTAALLRGDVTKRYAAYAVAIEKRIMNPNEVRGLENLNAYEGGDEFLVPLNIGGEAAAKDGEVKEPETPDKVEAKIAELLQCEATRICHAARTAANFVGWLDAFYARWLDTWIDALLLDNDGASVMKTCIETRKLICLEVAGQTTDKNTLAAALAATTAMWPTLAAQYKGQLQ